MTNSLFQAWDIYNKYEIMLFLCLQSIVLYASVCNVKPTVVDLLQTCRRNAAQTILRVSSHLVHKSEISSDGCGDQLHVATN